MPTTIAKKHRDGCGFGRRENAAQNDVLMMGRKKFFDYDNAPQEFSFLLQVLSGRARVFA